MRWLASALAFMERLVQDIRYSLRSLAKSRGFVVVAAITLAVGIGANTAIFSVVNSVLWQPLPYSEANKLVLVWGNFLKLNMERMPAKAADYNDYAAQNEIFDTVAGFRSQHFIVTGDDRPERISGVLVTPNLFSVLQVQPIEGRVFAPEESQSDREQVIVLSYGFWKRRFAGNRGIVSQLVRLDDQSYRVVGVMPAGFDFPHASFPNAEPAEVFFPLKYTSEQVSQRRGPYFVNVLARLKPGVTLVQARNHMDALARRLEREQQGYRGPNGEDGGWRITIVPLEEEIVGASRRPLLVLFGAVGLVLMIACANVANLLLLRAARRKKEFAVRVALGATRLRIARQLLIEALLLTLLGGGLGLLLAHWGVDVLVALGSRNLPRAQEIGVDMRVLAFTAFTAILTLIFLGLAPAVHVSKLDLQSTLKETGRGTADPRRKIHWSNLVVVVEVALSLVLLIGAGLLANSLLRLQRVSPGILVEHLVTAEINLSAARYQDATHASAFYQELAKRVQSLPGVQAASFGTLQPLSGAVRNDPFAIEGRPLNPADLTFAGWQLVGPGYFRTLGIPLLKGRDLTDADMMQGSPVVAVINERMASRYWPNEDPIGRRITLGLPRADNPWITIVGVAKDSPHRIDSKSEPDWYLSRTLGAQLNRHLFVRATGDPTTLVGAIRSEVSAIDRDQPLTSFKTMKEVLGETIAPRRFNAMLLGVFAVIALGLAAIGTYSVISYSVSTRVREIGIRMALGARRSNVLGLIIKRGMAPALVGTLLGLIGAVVMTRFISSLLFEVSPSDTATYVLVSLFSLLIALLACYIPARRATKVDPLETLRYE